MINVGIVGCGFVDGTIKARLEVNNRECALFIGDSVEERI